jgi:hypothetical protein
MRFTIPKMAINGAAYSAQTCEKDMENLPAPKPTAGLKCYIRTSILPHV